MVVVAAKREREREREEGRGRERYILGAQSKEVKVEDNKERSDSILLCSLFLSLTFLEQRLLKPLWLLYCTVIYSAVLALFSTVVKFTMILVSNRCD